MDWSRTKTIFILVFLILDLFLVFQFMEKRTSSQLDYITESTIEEQLEADEITYIELSEESVNESYITGKRKKFMLDDVSALENQSISFVTEERMIARFDEPMQLPKENMEAFLYNVLAENVMEGSQYSYWGFKRKENQLVFAQLFNGKPLYSYEHAMLTLQLDDRDQLIGYEQTLLTDIKEITEEGSKQKIVSPMKAIENLYNKNFLSSGSEVTSVDLGYSESDPISEEDQFLAPTWHIVVDGSDDYFVNAIDGQVMELLQDGVEVNEFAF